MHKPSILIDFDKTISPIHGFTEPPSNETVESIRKLSTKFKIVIYSCRANKEICIESDLLQLIDYLGRYNIPYDEIAKDKPLYTAIIDDRAFNPLKMSWNEICRELIK